MLATNLHNLAFSNGNQIKRIVAVPMALACQNHQRSLFGRHGRTDILDGNQTLISLVTRYGYNRLKMFKVLRIRFSFIKNNADI